MLESEGYTAVEVPSRTSSSSRCIVDRASDEGLPSPPIVTELDMLDRQILAGIEVIRSCNIDRKSVVEGDEASNLQCWVLEVVGKAELVACQ